MLTERLMEADVDGGFYLTGYSAITDRELDILAEYPWTSLIMDCSAIDDSRLARLHTAASPRRELEVLGLWSAKLLTDQAIAWVVKAFKSIRHFQLADYTSGTNETLKYCLDMPKLTELLLDNWQIDGAGLQYLRRLNRLTYLTLAHFPRFNSANLALLDGMFILSLCLASSKIDCAHLPLLKGIRGLVELDLTDIGLTDNGLGAACEIGTLEALKFEQTADVTDVGFARLASLQRLHRLHACCPLLTDEGGRVLVGLPSLQDLRLTGAQITDDTVKELGERKQITRLGLIDCAGVTDESVDALAGLVNLEKLSVRGTSISKGAFDRLQAVLPNCRMRMN